MAILGNYKNNFDTETTTANNSMGFDPSAIQSCLLLLSVEFGSMNPVPSRLSIICRSVCLTVGRTGMYLLHV